MKRLSVAVVATLLAACSPPAAETQTAPQAAAPVAEQAGAVTLTRDFLVGSWGDNGDCTAVSTFNADGTYEIGGATGTWALEGDIITMSGAGGTFQLRAEALNDHQILIGNPNGSIGLSQRC